MHVKEAAGSREALAGSSVAQLPWHSQAGFPSLQGCTRLDQLVEWCGPDFDGLVVFDECHKVGVHPGAWLLLAAADQHVYIEENTRFEADVLRKVHCIRVLRVVESSLTFFIGGHHFVLLILPTHTFLVPQTQL